MKVEYSYLAHQFANFDDYIDELREFVASGQFTLGLGSIVLKRSLLSISVLSIV